MLISREREKLINAIVFFAENTRYCGKIKLFKLLYLLDFEHFRQTGLSVTGLEYRAWQYGPVPAAVAQEWDAPQADFQQAIRIEPEPVFDYTRQAAKANVPFNDRYFTRRELQILGALAEKYRDDYAMPMVNVTHVENGAWAKVWADGRGMDQPIEYALALREDEPNRAGILETAAEYASIAAASALTHH